MGWIAAAHGLGGEVRVVPLSDFPERFRERRFLWVEGEEEPRRVEAVRFHRGAVLVKLQGVEGRAQAEELRGRHLSVPVAELPPLPEGTFYYHQILGCEARTEDGRLLGRVADILRTGANDVYVVKPADGSREYLVPAVASVVRLDPDRGILVVKPLPGLLD